MRKLKDIKQQTNNKYLNLYAMKFEDENKEINYFFASRRRLEDVAINNKEKVDAVRGIPYYYKNNKLYVVLIKEFRYVINDYIYSVPAGLIDENEKLEDAIKRELKEEIGAICKKIVCTHKPSYISVGMTDEKIACFECEVELSSEQKLDENEDINIEIVEIDELDKFIKNHEIDFQSELQLSEFLYKAKLKKFKEKEYDNRRN